MPAWLGSLAGAGRPPAEAAVQDFLQDQPMIKFPYFTNGEVSAADIEAFIARCNELEFTP